MIDVTHRVGIAIVASCTGLGCTARNAETVVRRFTDASAIGGERIVLRIRVTVIAGRAWQECASGGAGAIEGLARAHAVGTINIVAGVTVLYTFFGGFIGASYTDMMQGLLMMAALLMVPALGIFEVGGPAQMLETVTAINPNAFSLIAGTISSAAIINRPCIMSV